DDAVAAVAAETRAAAREAAALIDVRYEAEPPVTNPLEAMSPGAPALQQNSNGLSISKVKRGDVDGALASAAHVATETFQTQFVEHAFLEPEARLAAPDPEPGIARHSHSPRP